MTKLSCNRNLANLFDDAGYMRVDRRFRLTQSDDESSPHWIVWLNDIAMVEVPTCEKAVYWISEQPPPSGSLQLGTRLARVTNALGIKKCGSCASRQIQMNSIGVKK